MAALAWVGGGNNQADNPNDWSPMLAPRAGDTLTMSVGGIMNIEGNALHGDTLTLGGGSSPLNFVLNVSQHAMFTEAATFPPLGISSITINLNNGSVWSGGFSSNLGGGVTINGAGNFDNQASTVTANSVVNVDVIGQGTFKIDSAQSVRGSLEFMQSVGGGQNITVEGDPVRGAFGTLTIDDPHDFHASTTLGFGEIVLAGLTADSYSLQNDMLSLFSGKQVVEQLHLTVAPQLGANDFGVSQTGSGIILHADDGRYAGGGSLLPLHS